MHHNISLHHHGAMPLSARPQGEGAVAPETDCAAPVSLQSPPAFLEQSWANNPKTNSINACWRTACLPACRTWDRRKGALRASMFAHAVVCLMRRKSLSTLERNAFRFSTGPSALLAWRVWAFVLSPLRRDPSESLSTSKKKTMIQQ